MRIRREQTVAIAIDYQEKLVPAMYDSERLIRNSSVLLKGLRILDVPIILTSQYTKGLGMTVGEITQAAGSADYYEKLAFSAFDTVRWKLRRGARFVIVCGIEAHICVLQTVTDLCAAGYVPVLVTDCVSSRKESDFKVAVERAIREGALVATYESVLFELLETAGTDMSRKIQNLVK